MTTTIERLFLSFGALLAPLKLHGANERIFGYIASESKSSSLAKHRLAS